jgi:hypothetical protein
MTTAEYMTQLAMTNPDDYACIVAVIPLDMLRNAKFWRAAWNKAQERGADWHQMMTAGMEATK